MASAQSQTVTAVRHWNDSLFSFRMTRPPTLRFRSGEFVMLGLPDETGRPVLRAYSIASPAWDDELEFYSIKVANGPLTSRLQHIQPGDAVLMRPKPVGTLVHDALRPGRRLWLLATGTGFAPFASILRDAETYEKFTDIIVMHTCRDISELGYSSAILQGLATTPLVEDLFGNCRIHCYQTTTREPSARMGRITDALQSGQVFADLGIAGLSRSDDRLMICGSYPFNTDMKALLEARGLHEGSNAEPGDFVIEKAFVGDGAAPPLVTSALRSE